ncbi:hypothetical protein Pelo_10356 [Pelomyxa schiedti]|nr:hypothetical protein Pelo_10356 [Pelomyxa schiedti]
MQSPAPQLPQGCSRHAISSSVLRHCSTMLSKHPETLFRGVKGQTPSTIVSTQGTPLKECVTYLNTLLNAGQFEGALAMLLHIELAYPVSTAVVGQTVHHARLNLAEHYTARVQQTVHRPRVQQNTLFGGDPEEIGLRHRLIGSLCVLVTLPKALGIVTKQCHEELSDWKQHNSLLKGFSLLQAAGKYIVEIMVQEDVKVLADYFTTIGTPVSLLQTLYFPFYSQIFEEVCTAAHLYCSSWKHPPSGSKPHHFFEEIAEILKESLSFRQQLCDVVSAYWPVHTPEATFPLPHIPTFLTALISCMTAQISKTFQQLIDDDMASYQSSGDYPHIDINETIFASYFPLEGSPTNCPRSVTPAAFNIATFLTGFRTLLETSEFEDAHHPYADAVDSGFCVLSRRYKHLVRSGIPFEKEANTLCLLMNSNSFLHTILSNQLQLLQKQSSSYTTQSSESSLTSAISHVKASLNKISAQLLSHHTDLLQDYVFSGLSEIEWNNYRPFVSCTPLQCSYAIQMWNFYLKNLYTNFQNVLHKSVLEWLMSEIIIYSISFFSSVFSTVVPSRVFKKQFVTDICHIVSITRSFYPCIPDTYTSGKAIDNRITQMHVENFCTTLLVRMAILCCPIKTLCDFLDLHARGGIIGLLESYVVYPALLLPDLSPQSDSSAEICTMLLNPLLPVQAHRSIGARGNAEYMEKQEANIDWISLLYCMRVFLTKGICPDPPATTLATTSTTSSMACSSTLPTTASANVVNVNTPQPTASSAIHPPTTAATATSTDTDSSQKSTTTSSGNDELPTTTTSSGRCGTSAVDGEYDDEESISLLLEFLHDRDELRPDEFPPLSEEDALEAARLAAMLSS